MGYICKSLILLQGYAGMDPLGSAWGVADDIVHTHPIFLFPKKF